MSRVTKAAGLIALVASGAVACESLTGLSDLEADPNLAGVGDAGLCVELDDFGAFEMMVVMDLGTTATQRIGAVGQTVLFAGRARDAGSRAGFDVFPIGTMGECSSGGMQPVEPLGTLNPLPLTVTGKAFEGALMGFAENVPRGLVEPTIDRATKQFSKNLPSGVVVLAYGEQLGMCEAPPQVREGEARVFVHRIGVVGTNLKEWSDLANDGGTRANEVPAVMIGKELERDAAVLTSCTYSKPSGYSDGDDLRFADGTDVFSVDVGDCDNDPGGYYIAGPHLALCPEACDKVLDDDAELEHCL